MLVSLPALLAAKFRAVALPAAFLGQGLAVAGSPYSRLLEGRVGVVPGHVVQLVVDGAAVLHAHGPAPRRESRGRETGRRGRQAADDCRPREAVLGHGVSAGIDGDREGRGHVAGFLEGGGDGGDIGNRVGHALAAGDAVGAIEGAAEERVRVISRVGLSAERQAARHRGRRDGRAVRQRPRGLLYFLARERRLVSIASVCARAEVAARTVGVGVGVGVDVSEAGIHPP